MMHYHKVYCLLIAGVITLSGFLYNISSTEFIPYLCQICSRILSAEYHTEDIQGAQEGATLILIEVFDTRIILLDLPLRGKEYFVHARE